MGFCLFQMALPSPDYLPPLEEEDRTYFINKKIFDALLPTLEKVASWGSNKPVNQSFLDYFKNTIKLSNRKINKVIHQNDMHKLDQFNFRGLDITFICPLLTLMCDNIAEVGSEDWKTSIKDETKVECQINKIRELRNAVTHEPLGKAVDNTLSDELERIVLKLLENARMMYKIPPGDVDQAKKEVKKQIAEIKIKVWTEKEKGSLLYRKLFIKEGVPKLRKDIAKYQDKSPLVQHITGFYNLKLTNGNKVIPSTELLRPSGDSSNNRIIFIEGQSGSGKSTLVKQIRADILQEDDKPRIFARSRAFQIPLFFPCRNVKCRTMVDLVKLTFHGVARKLKEEELVGDSIGQMINILLIDGLDELTDDSKALIEGEIVPFLKNHEETTCIFTSRPQSVKTFQARLQQEGLSFETFKIKELETKEEQIDFINVASVGGSDVSKSYGSSKLDLRFPVLLALYSFLHNLDSNSVNLLATSSHLMHEAIEYGLRDAANRIHQKNVEDCERKAKKVCQKIAFLSFSCLLHNKLSLEEPDINWLIEESEKCLYSKVSTIDVISCFLPSIASDTFGSVSDGVDYFHKSHQETLASIYVCQQMIGTALSVEEIFSEAIRKYKKISESDKGTDFDVRDFLMR